MNIYNDPRWNIYYRNELKQIAKMYRPCRCTCGKIYDTATVTVIARYTDCSVWITPCCKRQVDDRGETGWKSIADYTLINKEDFSL